MESDTHDTDVVERVIPAENIQIMFHYKNPFVVLHNDHSETKQPRSIISGLSNSFSDVSTNGETGVAFVSFHPTGACHFFEFPLFEIENLSIDMSEIFNAEIKMVEEMLYFKKTIQEKVAVIESFLMGHYSPIPAYDNQLIQKGVEIVKHSRGLTSARHLSDCLYTTPKTLERKFSKYLGKTPKQLIKLMRFQGVLRDFGHRNDCNTTEYAYNNGYFDQSHFIHDFKAYTGYTPGEFIARYPDYSVNAENC